ncbi:hypothetical protein ACFFRR_009237 [Megaselia abdita]
MRTKKLIVVIFCFVLLSILLILFNGGGNQNDSIKNIYTQTHEHLKELQVNLRVASDKKLEIDEKYLEILGFINGSSNAEQLSSLSTSSSSSWSASSSSHFQPSSTIRTALSNNLLNFNGTKTTFSIVTYVQTGETSSVILLLQNIANKLPNENIVLYDLGLTSYEYKTLSPYCNYSSAKCTIVTYDLTVFPSHIPDKRMMHAYRPIVIKDALLRSKTILFMENTMRLNGTSRDVYDLLAKLTSKVYNGGTKSEVTSTSTDTLSSGVLGWSEPTAVSTRSHPKMFEYFQTKAEEFIFLRMIDLDAIFFTDSKVVSDQILLPWIKCAFTLECLDPIGAQSNGCKYNKKPQYRYSGCHAYDTSALNIVLGLTWHMDHSKYSIPKEGENTKYIFSKQSLSQSSRILDNRRRNITDTSEHPYSDE